MHFLKKRNDKTQDSNLWKREGRKKRNWNGEEHIVDTIYLGYMVNSWVFIIFYSLHVTFYIMHITWLVIILGQEHTIIIGPHNSLFKKEKEVLCQGTHHSERETLGPRRG